ncbi:hypothetical protein ES703_114552 [subsurface metagenome]
MEYHQADYNPRSGGRRQAYEAHMCRLVLLVFHIESGQPNGRTAYVYRCRQPDETLQKTFVGETGRFELVFQNLEHQKRRCHTEADYIAEAVELAAEAGGALYSSCEPAVEHIGKHCQQYHITGQCEGVLAREYDGGEAADAVENRYQRRQNRDVLQSLSSHSPQQTFSGGLGFQSGHFSCLVIRTLQEQ